MAYIRLNKQTFFNNLDIISAQCKGVDKLALVLKDNAYGHGILEISQMAKEYGVTKAIVQSASEAEAIQEYFEYILVLADFPHAKSANSDKIRYTINDINAISAFPHATKVELKVDTGMHRNGIAMDEIEKAVRLIKERGLILEAVFTHHRSADELSSEWFWQNENFAKVKEKTEELACGNLRFHSANSASLFRTKHFNEDMVRVGIAAYGCLEFPDSFIATGLKPILSLYANKVSTRALRRGQRLGYGASETLENDELVSNYDFGYGDGFLRACSNNYKNPHAKKLVGRISMDNASFVADDEELLIFNDANEVARQAGTIGYEVLTSLKPNIKRVIS